MYTAALDSLRYPYVDNARYYLRTEGDMEKIKQIHELGARTLGRWIEQPPTAKLLEHAKLVIRNGTIFKGQEAFGRGRPGVITSGIVKQLPQFPVIVSEAEHLDRIDQVEPESLRSLAQSLLEAPRSFSLVGSDKSVKEISDYLA